MKMQKWLKQDPHAERRLRLITDLDSRRACLLQSIELNLEALSQLMSDYEAADLSSAADDLRHRLEYYRSIEK